MMKKALLVVSFGTSYPDTRERTIGAIEEKLGERFPDREVRRAWTSSFIIRRVAKAEGLAVDTPEEALAKLVQDDFDMLRMWVTSDVRPGRKDEKWLNCLLRKR